MSTGRRYFHNSGVICLLESLRIGYTLRFCACGPLSWDLVPGLILG